MTTMFTRSTSIPRPKMSVATKILFSKFLNSLYLEILEASKHQDVTSFNGHSPLLLRKTRMHRNARETTLPQELVELNCASDALDKDDDLVKVERVEKVVQFAVLLRFLKSEKVLLETMEGEL